MIELNLKAKRTPTSFDDGVKAYNQYQDYIEAYKEKVQQEFLKQEIVAKLKFMNDKAAYNYAKFLP